jgi:hypothetical protein
MVQLHKLIKTACFATVATGAPMDAVVVAHRGLFLKRKTDRTDYLQTLLELHNILVVVVQVMSQTPAAQVD